MIGIAGLVACYKKIQDVLALKLLEGEFKEGQTVEVDALDNHLNFKAVTAPEGMEETQTRQEV